MGLLTLLRFALLNSHRSAAPAIPDHYKRVLNKYFIIDIELEIDNLAFLSR